MITGGTHRGTPESESKKRLPGKSRRATIAAAGMPIRHATTAERNASVRVNRSAETMRALERPSPEEACTPAESETPRAGITAATAGTRKARRTAGKRERSDRDGKCLCKAAGTHARRKVRRRVTRGNTLTRRDQTIRHRLPRKNRDHRIDCARNLGRRYGARAFYNGSGAERFGKLHAPRHRIHPLRKRQD